VHQVGNSYEYIGNSQCMVREISRHEYVILFGTF